MSLYSLNPKNISTQ